MNLENLINEDIKQAMLAKEKDKLEALRAVKSAILLEKTGKETAGNEITGDTEIKLLQRLVKQRKESAGIYKEKGRDDLAQNELFQVSVIEKYLPKQMSETELEEIVKKVISDVGANDPKDMGKVMGAANKIIAGRAENKVVADKIKLLLSK